MSDVKRFDDYTECVECNDCSHYWDSTCDGVSKGSRVGCNSFLATRSVVIPAKLNSLENRVKWLRICCIINTGLVLGLLGVVLSHG